jgi:hypothetical protein
VRALTIEGRETFSGDYPNSSLRQCRVLPSTGWRYFLYDSRVCEDSMGNPIFARGRHFTALWKEGLWEKWLVGAYTLVGLGVFVRDEIWRPENRDQWAIINLIPHFSLAC